MSNPEKESFSIRAERRNGVARISAIGELDLRTVPRATENGNVLVVVNSSENVRKVFELTRTEHLFEAAISNDPTVAEFNDERGWLPIAIPEVGDG